MTTTAPLSQNKIETSLITIHNLHLSRAFTVIILFEVQKNSVNSYKSFNWKSLKDQTRSPVDLGKQDLQPAGMFQASLRGRASFSKTQNLKSPEPLRVI